MKKKRFSRTALLLLLIGAAAQLAACFALLTGDTLLQYAICAPDVRKIEATASNGTASAAPRYETGLEEKARALKEVQEQLSDGLSALSMGGARSGETISAGNASATGTLWAVDGRWLETCPRRMLYGRWMDGSEFEYGVSVAVLDEALAFKLFASEDPVGKKVRIGEADYRVVGTVRHRRDVGDVDEYGAYIPLNAAAKQGLQMDTLTMYAVPAAQAALDQTFSAEAESAWGRGSFHNLRKEAMGGLLLTRVIAFAFGMAMVARLVRGLARLAGRFGGEIRAMHARGYARQYLPPSVARVLAIVVGALALLVAAYALLSFLIEPVYTFTEWVPESLVELSALEAVFWSRAADAARLVRIATPESAHIAFWSMLARLGAAIFLLGLALGRGRAKAARRD